MAKERLTITKMMAIVFLTAWIWISGCGGSSSDEAKDSSTTDGEYTAVAADFENSADAASASALVTNTSTLTYSSAQEDLISLVSGLSIKETVKNTGARPAGSTKELYDNNGCPVITTEGTIVDRLLIITFEDACDMNGIPVSGVISGQWDYSSTSEGLLIDLELNDFKVDDRSVDGEMLLEADVSDKAELSIDADLTLINAEQKSTTITVDNLSVLCDFNSTNTDPEDDQYTMNGTGQYTDADGKIYSLTFTNVVSTFLCYYPVSGTVKIVSTNPSYTATVDFGSGSCDSKAVITIGRQTKEVDLSEPLDL
jgi:hypothetical protein